MFSMHERDKKMNKTSALNLQQQLPQELNEVYQKAWQELQELEQWKKIAQQEQRPERLTPQKQNQLVDEAWQLLGQFTPQLQYIQQQRHRLKELQLLTPQQLQQRLRRLTPQEQDQLLHEAQQLMQQCMQQCIQQRQYSIQQLLQLSPQPFAQWLMKQQLQLIQDRIQDSKQFINELWKRRQEVLQEQQQLQPEQPLQQQSQGSRLKANFLLQPSFTTVCTTRKWSTSLALNTATRATTGTEATKAQSLDQVHGSLKRFHR